MKPELLAPAGDWSALLTAVDNGADSVYFGVPGFNMRARADNFDPQEIPRIMDYLHARNRRGYLALNTVLFDPELAAVRKIVRQAQQAGVDAAIVWDMAAFQLAREEGLAVHLSTQASVANFSALRFYSQAGARRVILARECTLDHIRAMRQARDGEGLGCEIEVFVHGAMCLSISGRCFLSLYAHGKSANRGQCYQPCRREYYIQDQKGGADYLLGKDYLLSPRDLCTLDFLDQVLDTGVDAVKIEGRMRSAEYVGVVTSVYRRAIDAWHAGELGAERKQTWKGELEAVYNRGFSTGFYLGPPTEESSHGMGHSHEKVFLGDVRNYYKRIQVAEIQLSTGPLRQGDELLILGKRTPARYAFAQEMQQNHEAVTVANQGQVVAVRLPFEVRPKDKIFLWRKVRQADSESGQSPEA